MIAQAHVVSMECVYYVKIAPHEPVVSVNAVESAMKNAGPGIKFAPGRKAILLENLRRHAARLKRNPVVAVALVQPPVFVEQTSLFLQPLVKGSAGKRGQMVEGGNVERVFLSKLDRVANTFRRVAVVTENERAIDAHAMAAQIPQGFLKAAAHGVERLVHVFEVRRIQTLESNQHALATAPHKQIEKFLVMRRIDAGLAHPTNSQRNQGPEKLLGLFKIRRDVVVHEEKELPRLSERKEFGNDRVNRTAVLRGFENRLHGTKVAFEMTPAPSFDQPNRQVTFAAKNGAVGFEILK